MNDPNISYYWGVGVEAVQLILIWIFEMLKERHFKLTIGQLAMFIFISFFSWLSAIFTFGFTIGSFIELVAMYFDKPIIEYKNKKEES